MAEESKEVDPGATGSALKEVIDVESAGAAANDEIDEVDADEGPESTSTDAVAAGATAKKKKSKKAKLKKALGAGGKDDAGASSSSNLGSKLTKDDVERLLEKNPSLKGEVSGMSMETATEALKKMNVSELLTGMVCHCFDEHRTHDWD